MSVIKGVLKEEVERLERNIEKYESILSSLPHGSLFVRRIGSEKYAYLKRKENGKVISFYLGNIKNIEVQKQIELCKEYKRIKNNIRISNEELQKLKKAYKVYERK